MSAKFNWAKSKIRRQRRGRADGIEDNVTMKNRVMQASIVMYTEKANSWYEYCVWLRLNALNFRFVIKSILFSLNKLALPAVVAETYGQHSQCIFITIENLSNFVSTFQLRLFVFCCFFWVCVRVCVPVSVLVTFLLFRVYSIIKSIYMAYTDGQTYAPCKCCRTLWCGRIRTWYIQMNGSMNFGSQ